MATYTVVRGDTLDAIAHRYNTTFQELARVNNIPNPNLITVNQVIQVPPYATPSSYDAGSSVSDGMKYTIGVGVIGLLIWLIA